MCAGMFFIFIFMFYLLLCLCLQSCLVLRLYIADHRSLLYSITTHGICKIYDTYGTWRARNLSTLRGHMVNHSCDSDCFALRPWAIQSSSRSEMAIFSMHYHSLVIHETNWQLGYAMSGYVRHCFKHSYCRSWCFLKNQHKFNAPVGLQFLRVTTSIRRSVNYASFTR